MSRTTIRIPTPLRSFTGGQDEVTIRGFTVREQGKWLSASYQETPAE